MRQGKLLEGIYGIMHVIFLLLMSHICHADVMNLRYKKAPLKLKVMTFNIEYGAIAYDIQSIVDRILAIKVDIAVINEHLRPDDSDASIDIAKKLGWYHTAADFAAGAVISRWHVEIDPKFQPPQRDSNEHWISLGGWISVIRVSDSPEKKKDLPPHIRLTPFNVIVMHLNDVPYQPYQARGIPYDACTEQNSARSIRANTTDCATTITDSEDLVNAAWHARGKAVQEVIGIARNLTESNRSVVIAGDFNEPSDLDWTSRAVMAKRVPLRAKFKVSRRLRAAGMKDVYRAIYPDEMKNPGYTWYDSPTGSMAGGSGPPERIDFLYVPDSPNVLILDCEVGEKNSNESDHLPVSATLVFKNGVW